MSFEYSLFISYRRNEGDAKYIANLTNILHSEAQKVTNKSKPFFDEKSIKWGEEFDDKIYEAIVSCYFFVPLYHNTYLHSDNLWCAKELYRAIEVEKKIRESCPHYSFILPIIDRGRASEFPNCIGRKNAKEFNTYRHIIKKKGTSKAYEEFIEEIHNIFLENFKLIEESSISFFELCSSIPIPTDEEIKDWVYEQKGILKEKEREHVPILKKTAIS